MFPQFGALIEPDGVRFRVHAPRARRVRVVVHGGAARGKHEMSRDADGLWSIVLPAAPGDLYSLRVDDSREVPDPASRFQPQGVHGLSQIVDPSAFAWTDGEWRGVPRGEIVIYELHTGTFTPEGTFAGVRDRLPVLRDLGVTAIELMPVADFPGARNWGYDGVALYAPSRAYGTPDDLRALVDRAHALGLAVILDVVYNHLGPEGAYLPLVNPEYLVARETPWGAAVNIGGEGSAMVRRFIIDNAVHWIREYHMDGLRLDATHALAGDDDAPFMRELADAVRGAAMRPVLLYAEDHRNLNQIVSDAPDGWGFDGIWADDFHHAVRVLVAGDCHGYYQDFEGTTAELARTIRQGWLYTGEPSRHLKVPRGTDPSAVPMDRSVVCIQNHDQIGNRAFGERLHHQIDAATWRAASVLLLIVPMTPLLFMGQEWAASTPFLFFTDLEPELGKLVTEGRRREFRDFPAFSSPEARDHIPDPQAPDTFEASTLRWEERDQPEHAAVLALYHELLHLRRREPALHASAATAGEAFAADAGSIVVRRHLEDTSFWIAVRLRGSGTTDIGAWREAAGERGGLCETVLTTEDRRLAIDPAPPRITAHHAGPVVEFERPGAAIFRFAFER